MQVTLSPEEELQRIKEFLNELQDLLDGVVKHPNNIIPGRHHS